MSKRQFLDDNRKIHQCYSWVTGGNRAQLDLIPHLFALLADAIILGSWRLTTKIKCVFFGEYLRIPKRLKPGNFSGIVRQGAINDLTSNEALCVTDDGISGYFDL
jgi:hypothetical protein